MSKKDTEKSSRVILLLAFFILLLFAAALQFLSPYLYGPDSYYHIKIASLIKERGIYYYFRWAEFSTFTTAFSDKDFLLHLLAFPFTYIPDIILSGKIAAIFMNTLLLLTIVFVLRKYLPYKLTAFFLFLTFLSSHFLIYLLKLRPATLVTIINLLGVYFLIRKRWVGVGIFSLIYTLTHVSFPLIIVFTFLCELIRYLYQKEFFLRNISAVMLGAAIGCTIHPYYPNNILVFYLNGILVPAYTFLKYNIDFGLELYPVSTKIAFVCNFTPIAMMVIAVWHNLIHKTRISLSTIIFFGAANVYVFLGMMAVRFWYQASVFIIVFCASYVCDLLKNGNKIDLKRTSGRITLTMILCIMILGWGLSLHDVFAVAKREAKDHSHYHLAAEWMKNNIPAGKTIYHAYWSDSPYFFCLNPKNNYMVILDPIYMYYKNPSDYFKYHKLKRGRYKEPHKILKENFSIEFGYARKISGFYRSIKDNPHFKIRYEDNVGVVFQIVDVDETS